MNYLTLEQALADYAHFLRWFTETNNIDNPPIITFGGSYQIHFYTIFLLLLILVLMKLY